jgi:alpha-L-fucosidase
VPSWYEDAKLGIMINWGPSAVPAWAPPTGDPPRVIAEQGWEYLFAHDPRAEWYGNSMLIPGSPTYRRHRTAWGRMGRYDTFARTFRQGLRDWDPGDTLGAIAGSGARYLLVSTKHHDGFALWPARRRNPRKRGWQVSRDVVGELAEGARAHGMKFGVYYSSGLDWTFGGTPIRSLADLVGAIPRTKSYSAYVDAQWRELIARYSPSILWSDIGSPAGQDLLSLFSDYYESVPDGLINDRFGQPDLEEPGNYRRRIVRMVTRLFSPRAARIPARTQATLPVSHADFHTVDSDGLPPDTEGPWECVRPLGYSMGHSTDEADDHVPTVSALVRLLCDVTARGGNLLLGVGPQANGSLSPLQASRLLGLGEWLKLNGEAIFGSRPWGEGESATEDGIEVRYTCRGMTTYALLLGTPAGRTIVLPSLRLLPYAGLRILGSIGYTTWFQEGKDIHIRLTEPLRESPAHVISITPKPRA